MAKQLLQEGFTVNKNNINKIPLKESEQIIEKDGTEYKCRGAYEIPVWRLGEKNLNGRIYGKTLAEKVIKEKQTTLGLANHPKDEADVLNTFAVEKNPHIRENIFYVDAYLVGKNGELAKEIIEAGGEIGLSSSAYGDVDNSSGNVLEEGFEVERFADWVDNPSYQVFASKEATINNQNSVEENKKLEKSTTNINIEDNPNKQTETIKEDSTNIVEQEKETNSMSDKISNIEKKNFERGVKQLIKEATNAPTLKEKREAFQEVVEYCDGVDFAETYITEAKTKIGEIDQQLLERAEKADSLEESSKESEKTQKELQEKVDEQEKTLKEVQEEYDVAVSLLDDMKMREKKLKDMYRVALAEKNGMVTASEYKEVVQYAEEKEAELEELKEQVLKLKKKLRMYQEATLKEKEDMKKKDDEEDDEDDEDEEDEKKEKKESSKKKVSYEGVPKEIKYYYEDLLEENPRVEELANDILGCRTLLEAQMKYLKMKDLIEEDFSPQRFGLDRIEEDEPTIHSKRKTKRDFDLPLREGFM